MKAQTALQSRRKDDAHATLADYLRRGFVVDLGKNPDYHQVWDARLEDQQSLNQGPVGDLHTEGHA